METVAIGAYKCSQPECSVETTGKCVNGLSIIDCPNKIGNIKDTLAKDIPNTTTIDSKTVRIPWGESFQESELTMISYRYPCKLILLIGEPSCGKSTLYAALFDSFHKGSCGRYIFNSTRTPIAFEKICHLAREKSKGKVPDTERTKFYEFTYLHLAVRLEDLSKTPSHVLFADVNGEKFQAAKDSDNEIIKLTILKRADHIFFIADGGLLIDNKEKHVVKKDVWNMITRCIQNNMLNKEQSINLIITKWDEINTAGKIKDVNDFFIIPTLTKFSSIINKVIKVASRSMNDEVPPRMGIDEFLEICLSNKVNATEIKFLPEIKRQFQKFKYEAK